MSARRPNIVFILIDDLGWRDLACYGSGFYETPNLDRLAAEGVRFTDAYAACPVCSPTRASILTGKYPGTRGGDGLDRLARASHPAGAADRRAVHRAPAAGGDHACRALREGGYQTWHVGKWHLGGGLLARAAGLRREHRRLRSGAPGTATSARGESPTLPDGRRGST